MAALVLVALLAVLLADRVWDLLESVAAAAAVEDRVQVSQTKFGSDTV